MVTTHLTFSKNSHVQVFVDIYSTTLSLKPLVGDYVKGEDLKDKEFEALPIEVLLEFHNTTSIDVIIDALLKIKNNIENINIINGFALAC